MKITGTNPKPIEEVVKEALEHDTSDEWRFLIEATVGLTKAIYKFDEALRAFKHKKKDSIVHVDRILEKLRR